MRLDDPDFQAKMKELDAYFSQLKEEIAQVRMRDYRKTDIIAKSERFFNICDEATGLAEVYSQKKATQLNQLEKIVFADIARPSYPDRCRAGKNPSVCCFKPPAPKQGIFRRSHRPSQQK